MRLPMAVPTPRARRGRVARDDLFRACDEILAARRAGRTSGDADLLSLLLAARDDGEPLGDDEVRVQVLTFLLAGHETTSTALTFALHLLGRHPEVQDRVRSEVRRGRRGQPHRRDDGIAPAHHGGGPGDHAPLPLGPVPGQAGGRGRRGDGVRRARRHHRGRPPWTVHRHPAVWADPLTFDPFGATS